MLLQLLFEPTDFIFEKVQICPQHIISFIVRQIILTCIVHKCSFRGQFALFLLLHKNLIQFSVCRHSLCNSLLLLHLGAGTKRMATLQQAAGQMQAGRRSTQCLHVWFNWWRIVIFNSLARHLTCKWRAPALKVRQVQCGNSFMIWIHFIEDNLEFKKYLNG